MSCSCAALESTTVLHSRIDDTGSFTAFVGAASLWRETLLLQWELHSLASVYSWPKIVSSEKTPFQHRLAFEQRQALFWLQQNCRQHPFRHLLARKDAPLTLDGPRAKGIDASGGMVSAGTDRHFASSSHRFRARCWQSPP
mmetsp:Transcript_2666/g.8048  ORF Transcript_2666/g.8048 Transcript_2666/m.8048 type:complete len:141 (-) Transcript_2666:257-679(-)